MPLFEDWQLDPMPLYVAFPPSRHASRKLRVFIDWIVEVMAPGAGDTAAALRQTDLCPIEPGQEK